MKKILRSTLSVASVVLMMAFAPASHASIIFTLSDHGDDTVDMNINAFGNVNATSDTYLLIGDTTDSFLLSSSPGVGGGNPPVPGLTLNGFSAINAFHRDDNGGNGVQSLLGFNFGNNTLNGVINLADLNGDYHLQGTVFSHFVAGTFTGLISGTASHTLQGLGDITVVVQGAAVPAPATLALFGLGLLALGIRRKHA